MCDSNNSSREQQANLSIIAALTRCVEAITESILAYAEMRKERAKLQVSLLKNLNRVVAVAEPFVDVALIELENVARDPVFKEEFVREMKKVFTKAANKASKVINDVNR